MRYVIAVGGNALSSEKVLNKLSARVAVLFGEGNQVVITHGNGPQVGQLALHEKKSLSALTGETQLAIGDEIRRSLLAVPKTWRTERITVVPTRVIVSGRDREFMNPSKPIGKFYNEGEAGRLEAEKGFVMRKLLDGYRRVAPSPKPKEIVELAIIEKLLEGRHIVIAAGGGGIAMTKKGGKLVHADAVIDKDLASALLAIRLKADCLFILTNVDGIFLDFEKKGERMLGKVSVRDLARYERKGQFEAGSMLPKVKACIEFVKKTGRPAVIGNLEKADRVFRLEGATVVIP